MELLLRGCVEFQIVHVGAVLSAREVFTGLDHMIKALSNIDAHIDGIGSSEREIIICRHLFTRKINCTPSGSATSLAVENSVVFL